VNAVIEAAVSRSGHTLTDYQRDFLADEGPFRSVLKARQTGFSWLFALEALSQAIVNRHFSIFMSLNRDEASEKIMYARDLYESLPARYRPPLRHAGRFEMIFQGGGRLLSFPCLAPRGKAGASLYLDEMAFYPHSGRVYGGALPVITHGGRVTVASTPNGDTGMFWRLVSEPELASSFSQHTVPWWRAPWLCLDADAAEAEPLTDARVRRYGTEVLKRLRGAMDLETFQQEYELKFVDVNAAFISWPEIEANVHDIPLAATWEALAALGGRLYAGVDIGRVTNATEIIVIRDDGGRRSVVCIKSMVNEDFRTQETAVLDCLRIAGVERLCVDSTGLGMNLSEDLSRAYPGRVVALHFDCGMKETMARQVKRDLQAGILALPRQRSLLEQIHTVRRTWLASGRVRYDAPVVDGSHADKFWALAMALNAATGRHATVTAYTLR
jgi:phage FluMu gp28-like protein